MDVFKKQSTQKISNLKRKNKSILEYVQCMYNNVHAYKLLTGIAVLSTTSLIVHIMLRRITNTPDDTNLKTKWCNI